MGYQRISNQGLCNPAVRDLSFIHRDGSRAGGCVLTRQEAAGKWGKATYVAVEASGSLRPKARRPSTPCPLGCPRAHVRELN